jgi:hypothetical protein
MKHFAIAALAFFALIGTAAAQTTNPSTTAETRTHLTRAERRAEARRVRAAKKAAKVTKPAPGLSVAGRKALGRYRPPVDRDAIVVDQKAAPYAGPPVDFRPVPAVRTRPLRDMFKIPPPLPGDEDGEERFPEPVRPPPPFVNTDPDHTARQTVQGSALSAPTSSGISFDGVGVGLLSYSPNSNPPDVNGRVGATQYVQWNNTSFAIFNKTTGALLYGPAAGNTLFQPLGGACATHNDGDPVVSYDLMAGRWVLSQFVVEASPSFSHQCVAVSVSGDATGAYYLYDFVTDPVNFVDYPHMGVWPDGYYMSIHVFNSLGTAQVASRVVVLERDKMLLGQSARMVQADLGKKSNRFQYGFLPADLDSLTPPPAGEAAFVLGPDPSVTNRTDSTRVAVTWGVTPTIALTEATIAVGITTAPCVNNTAAQDNRDCVPQPSPAVAADYLDNISSHYMYRLAYRNFGGSPVQESLVVSATTGGSASSPSHGAVRWFEFRNAGNSTATPTSFQVSTFDPDTAYRWLPSIAMDKDHNIALGYSKSSTSIKPGIYMTGRLGTDTINTMGAETTVQAGVGSQTSGAGNRWGDYSAMTLDPIDQCTFYYTNEYLKTNGAFNWSTRIAAYKFPSCTPSPDWGTVNGNVTSCVTGAPMAGVVVSLSNGFAGSSDAAGNYSISVPPGSYTITAADTDRNCTTSSPVSAGVSVTSGNISTQNFCMTGTSNLQYNVLAISDSANGNNNGVVNRNECVQLNVTLKNNGCANETATTATLSTTTPGVTVTQPNSAYPDLAIDASGANATAFKVETSNSFVCGTAISFTLNLTYASGNKSIGFTVPTCSGGANQTIPLSSLTAADLTQSDRLGRDGLPSTCAGKTSPGGGFAGTKFYKTFSFTNSGGAPACFTVQINAALGGAGDIESAAYLTSYIPASIDTNYAGDSGIVGLGTSVGTASYSFTVPALTNFVVVVNTTGTTTSSQFSGTVSGFFDFTAGPGACEACIPPATPTITPGGPTTFCAGGSVLLTSSAPTGNQWYLNGSLIPSATNVTYSATASGSYTVVTTVAGCPSAPSTPVVVTVNPIPATPTITPGGPTTFCTGGSVTLTSSSASGNQWSLDGTPIGGATGQQHVATQAGNYTVIVTANGCSSAPSAATTVTINPIPSTPTITPGGPTTFCAGGNVTLTSSSASGNQWSLNGTPIGGATGQQHVATLGGNYTVTVTTNGCTSAASAATSVTVNPAPATPTITPGGPTTFCTGGSVTLTSSSASGNQWSLDGNPIGGATGQQHVATLAGNYTVVVTSGGCSSAPSAATTVTINPIPSTPTITPGGPTTFCAGGSVTLTSSSASGNQWSLDGTPIGGATGQQHVATLAGNYTVSVTTNGCASAPSSATTVTVNPAAATPTVTPGGPTTFCAGGSVTLTSSSATTYQWYNGVTLIPGETSQAYIATASGSYNVVVASGGCPSAPSSSTVVTVNPIPATPTISGGPTTFCEGGSVTLTSSSATGNQWSRDGVPLGGETGQTIVASVAGAYTVTVTASGCASAPSAATAVTVNPKPNVTISAPSPMFAGAGATASVIHECAGATFVWSITGGTITSGNGTRNITFTAGAAGTLTLFVNVTNSSGCSDSKSINITVTQAPFGAPPFLQANATGTTTASILWASVASADHYEVHRSLDNVNWSLRGTSAGLSFSDGSLTASTTYLYKVRAVKADLTASAFSPINAATTVVFTDPSLTACATLVKAVHITQLRTAINLARASVGLPAFTFTDPTLLTTTKIKAIHINELRTAVGAFTTAIGITPTYTDPTIIANTTIVKSLHVQELRDLVR